MSYGGSTTFLTRDVREGRRLWLTPLLYPSRQDIVPPATAASKPMRGTSMPQKLSTEFQLYLKNFPPFALTGHIDFLYYARGRAKNAALVALSGYPRY
jgi:hypothetical protein